MLGKPAQMGHQTRLKAACTLWYTRLCYAWPSAVSLQALPNDPQKQSNRPRLLCRSASQLVTGCEGESDSLLASLRLANAVQRKPRY